MNGNIGTGGWGRGYVVLTRKVGEDIRFFQRRAIDPVMHLAMLAARVTIVFAVVAVLPGSPSASSEVLGARELNLAWATKILCSSIFLSGLPLEEAMAHSVYPLQTPQTAGSLPELLTPGDISRVDLDRAARRVTLQAGEISRTAAVYGDQGCVLHPRDYDGVYFTPVALAPVVPEHDDGPWPSGEGNAPVAGSSPLNADLLDHVFNTAFHPDAYTAAMVVVHNGRIAGERYGAGADHDTLLASWSMGKSLTATLLGVLVEQGERLDLTAPAPVPEWQGAGDPRGAIRLVDLLRMSSGLKFSALSDPPATWNLPHPDHFYVYSGAIDVFDFVVNRSLEHPPGMIGRYRNSDPLAVGAIIRRTVEARGQIYLSFPQSDLFDRIGIRKLVLEPDPYGNFVMTGFEYGRASDWARLGLLYLRDGVWEGERILPEGWAELVSTPAPAWDRPVYGGLFWLNRTGTWNLPADAYYMAGGGGQYTIIVPSLDLVVVRMGHFKGGVAPAPGEPTPAAQHLNSALALLYDAFGDE